MSSEVSVGGVYDFCVVFFRLRISDFEMVVEFWYFCHGKLSPKWCTNPGIGTEAEFSTDVALCIMETHVSSSHQGMERKVCFNTCIYVFVYLVRAARNCEFLIYLML